jgi:hypothetical protein
MKSPSLLLQPGRTSAFTSIESNRTVATGEGGNSSSSAENNNVVKTLPQISSGEALLSASLAQRATSSWSMPARTAFQTKPLQMMTQHPTSCSTANRTVAEMSNSDKLPMADAQFARSIPQFVYTSDNNVRIDGASFTSQALPYHHQIPPGSYLSPFVAFPYPGLHLQDKVMSPFGVHALPSQLPGSPTALLRPNPVVNTLISPVLNIQVQSSASSGHAAPPANGVQNRSEKLLTTSVTGSHYQGADTTIKSDGVKKQHSQSPAMLSETSTTRKDNKIPAQKEGKATKNILKKYVADGMEQ